MMRVKRTLFAGAFLVASAAVASAADLPVAPLPPPPPMVTPAFDWSGPYIGVYVGLLRQQSAVTVPPPVPRAGIQAGYNIVRGNFLGGIEIQAGLYGFSAPLTLEGDLNARLGFILGQRFLLYSEAGLMVLLTPSIPSTTLLWTLSGGLEVALGQSWSIFAEGGIARPFGGGLQALVVEGGINRHLGN